MSLLQWGDFTLHSGEKSWWRIDCDAFTDSEIELLANMIGNEIVEEFHIVAHPGSHPGSIVPKLAQALKKYQTATPLFPKIYLIIDDVLTTGSSMETIRAAIQDDPYNKGIPPVLKGVVIFARGKCPDWITPIFQMPT